MQRKRRHGRKVKLELWKPQNAGKPQVLQSWGLMLCHVLKRWRVALALGLGCLGQE
jgi:hypothetical protein